ncbi:putative RNA polymerase II mediator complex component Srb8 [Periconia macrospinosa]|uniref:Putative RNA polymerase II mediator complex component Srb8 n=1 Tax=Periconia macrospinosa TaxID=97972 RepID=A0A2V1DDL7_9PLEO|nr:putative RNA polymerase II mediator complex component Srb8 [Periconia macrospinosa]
MGSFSFADLPSNIWRTSAAVIFFWIAASVIKRLWFHPLSAYPGPPLWAASRIPYVLSLLRGRLNEDMLEIHNKYGEIVRLGPNEISFSTEEAWKDIYMNRPGHKESKKDPIWYMAPNDMPQNIVTTTDINVRARMRRLLAPSFTEKSLREQAPVLDYYANLFMDRVQGIYNDNNKQGKPTVLNFLDWTNFYTMDIIGDLGIGESFHCLEESSYHPWVQTLYNFFKGMVFASAVRFFPITNFLLQHMIPKEILAKQKAHTDFVNEKILQRLDMSTNRPDLITPFLKDMKTAPEKMSLGEIQSTFAVILVAGSETTATTLVGVWYQLVMNPSVQKKLWTDLSRRFKLEEDINVESTKDIPYLDAIINESLRLCYAIPGGLPRVVPEGGDTYVGKYVPGGTQISIRPHVVLHSEKYFKNANQFIPERWLPLDQRPEAYRADHLGASQPFNVGPTGCIGKPLAWAEMRVIVAKVIWKYHLSMANDSSFSWAALRKMMIVEKDPLWLKVVRREP